MKTKFKNPLAKDFNELVNTKVLIRINSNSELGYSHIYGKLERIGSKYFIEGRKLNKKTKAYVLFLFTDVKNVTKTDNYYIIDIEIFYPFSDGEFRYDWTSKNKNKVNEFGLEFEEIKYYEGLIQTALKEKSITIYLGYPSGLTKAVFQGKLKYNDPYLYISNLEGNIFIKFQKEAIWNISLGWQWIKVQL